MVMNAAADMITVTSTNTLTHTAMNAAADMTMSMSTKNTLTRTVTNAAADMTTAMSTSMLTHMVMNAAADMTTVTSTSIVITFPVILIIAIAKFAIRMRNTAMYAVKAWLIAPAVCRMPIR